MRKTSEADVVVIGAGFFGLYVALLAARQGKKVLIVEQDAAPFLRASKVNQARLHLGYHYPRSMGTALNSIGFFNQFNEEFKSCVNSSFEKIYAIAEHNSLTPREHFEKFCHFAKIPLDEIPTEKYFKPYTVSGAYLTKEYSFDFALLRDQVLNEISKHSGVEFLFKTHIKEQRIEDELYHLHLSTGEQICTRLVVNATYAGLNQMLRLFSFPELKLRYELTEVVLGTPSPRLQNLGITVMDGSFFSAMPFGKTEYHSLTAVDYTPHKFSTDALPSFSCQDGTVTCSPHGLNDCNPCPNRPVTAFPWMNQILRNYFREDLYVDYKKSLYTVKTVLKLSEVDDSRPTYISVHGNRPKFISVFSGKINTVFELSDLIKVISESW